MPDSASRPALESAEPSPTAANGVRSRRLTKTAVSAAQKEDKRYVIWDSRIAGFGLLVLPSGVKTFVYNYRDRYGRSRRAHIGRFGALTAEQARKMAEAWALQVAEGGDPLAERRRARAALTVGELLDEYLESARFAEKAESTKAIDRGRIERHLRPLLGRRIAESLRPDDIRRALAAIRDGKTRASVKTRPRGRARITGGPGTAREAISLLRAVFAWAVEQEILPANPAAAVKIGSSGRRRTVMRGARDYESLFKTLDKAEAERRIRSEVADAIRLIALTGARRGEIAGLRWRHVRLEEGLVVIDRHKTARSTGEARIIGLPKAAQRLLRARREQAKAGAEDFVFPPASGAGPIALSRPWRAIREEAKLPEGIGLHGLRHSLATEMAMQGAQASEIMAALGHRQLATAQRYVHYAEDARARLAERSARTITRAMQGKKAAKGRRGKGAR